MTENDRKQLEALKGLLNVVESTAPDAVISVGYSSQTSQCCITVSQSLLRQLVSSAAERTLN